MKRFLALLVAIVFVTTGCAGSSLRWGKRYEWTKPDFSHEEFDKDRKECMDSIAPGGISSEELTPNMREEMYQKARKAFDECLVEKGYKWREGYPIGMKIISVIALVALLPLLPRLLK
jgi:hypothetical protein